MIKSLIIRVGKIFIAAALCWAILFGVMQLRPRAQAIEGPEVGEYRMLVGPEGLIDLRDTPCSPVVRQTVRAGTLVRIRERHDGCGEGLWLRVELMDGAQGWVPVDVVAEPEVSIGNFRLCAGDLASPTSPCESTPRLSDGGVWLYYDFIGLEPGDRLQRELVVGGETLALETVIWEGPSRGEALLNLADFEPATEGRWVVRFSVNGRQISAVPVAVR